MRLQVENIGKEYTDGGVRDVSFQIEPGSFTLLTGESGVGKTTLLNIITGMLAPDAGHVRVNDRDLYEEYSTRDRIELLGNGFGYMMQGVSLIPSLTVEDNITYPLLLCGKKYDRDRLDSIFEKLGISGIRKSYPGRISGGEYRRVLLAGVLLSEPEILFCDEPTSNLDSASAGIVKDMLYDYAKDGRSVVVATHDTAFREAGQHILLQQPLS